MHLPILFGSALTDIDPGLVIWTLVTFVILLVVLSRTAWKPILQTVEAREKRIREAVEAAAREREEAERMIAEHKASLDQARKEAAEMVRQAQAQVEKSREEHLAKARKEAEDLIAQARVQIGEEQRKAFAEVKAVAVDVAIQAASRLIQASMDEAKQRELVERYIEELPNTRLAS